MSLLLLYTPCARYPSRSSPRGTRTLHYSIYDHARITHYQHRSNIYSLTVSVAVTAVNLIFYGSKPTNELQTKALKPSHQYKKN